MQKIIIVGLVILLFLIWVNQKCAIKHALGIYSCDCEQFLVTEDNMMKRKVVVMDDQTPLYSDLEGSQSLESANRMDTFFLTCESGPFYGITKTEGALGERTFVLREHVFEWNSILSVGYSSSPHEKGRDPVTIYRSLEDAVAGSGTPYIVEMDEHGTDYSHFTNYPILLVDDAHGKPIYLIAAIYKLGDYEVLGFGFVPFTEEAHNKRRYVSREQFDNNIKNIIENRQALDDLGSNPRPSDIGAIYGDLLTLLFDPPEEYEAGFEELRELFTENEYLPDVGGPFAPERISGGGDLIAEDDLQKMYDEMIIYLNTDEYWHNGNAHIAEEWLNTHSR